MLFRSDDFPDLVHAVTTRKGGTHPCGLSMGLALSAPHGIAHRKSVCSALGIEVSHLVVSRQVHGNNVSVVGKEERGRGVYSLDTVIPGVDGLITRDREVALMALSADCPLMGLFDPDTSTLAVVHSGWRGTVQQIVCTAVKTMRTRFGVDPGNIRAVISPCIGPCCYRVGQEVIEKAGVLSPFLFEREGHACFDLWSANLYLLESSGVLPAHIQCAQICTFCSNDLFFSYRKEGKGTGLFALLLQIR
mgnify:CR=1 FL=1